MRLRDKENVVALGSPDIARLVSAERRSVLLSPPFFDLAKEAIEPSGSLPAGSLLTVFTPWEPAKGADNRAIAGDTVRRR